MNSSRKPDLSIEKKWWFQGFNLIAGVDEVGRGPIAGPVVAAAVILKKNYIPSGIDDSKKISQKKRATVSKQIESIAIIGIGWASSGEIDQLNILEATMLAMQRAIFSLQKQIILDPDYILIDGNKVPRLDFPSKAIVRGDEKSLSIAAASIVAKNKRDAFMTSLSKLYPGYGWEKNAGYGTGEHLAAIEREGITVHHRRSFKPIANYL